MSLLFHCPSRYTAGGIHIDSYLVLVSSCNSCVGINKSVMIIIIRALSLEKRPKEKKGQRKKKKEENKKAKKRKAKRKKRKAQRKKQKENKNKRGAKLLSFSTLVLQSSTCSSYRESHMLSLSYTSGNFSL